MSKPSYILSIDQGTTSSRAAIVSENGDIIFQENKEFKQHYPNDGWVEHNPKDILSTTIHCIQKVIKESGILISDIVTAGITNQRETIIAWNKKTGNPIYNAIVWQDRRTEDICQLLKDNNLSTIIKKKRDLLLIPTFQLQRFNGYWKIFKMQKIY